MRFNAGKLLHSPFFRVLFTWFWMLVSPFVVALAVASIFGIGIQGVVDYIESHRSLLVYIEIVSVGLVPVLFMILSKEDVTRYGIKKEGILESIVPSVLFVFVVYGLSYFLGGQLISFEFPQFQLSFPLNLWYVFLGLLAYGPLEVYFIVWLIENTDRVWGWGGGPLSTGVGVTVVVFAFMHILTTRSLINSVNVLIIFLFFGLVYKYTGNSVGPMIAWTLVNRQALLAASILFN